MILEQKILISAQELFFQYGIKSVTMDDIARHLGISKKTLYQSVENKKDLVKKSLLHHFDCEEMMLKEAKGNSNNAIEEMVLISEYANQILQQINPSAIYDLQKYYKESWAVINRKSEEIILTVIKENLETGIQQGLYRKEINTDIIAKFYVGKSDIILNTKLFPLKNYKPSVLHKEMIYYHLHAIVSEKGLKLLKKHQNKQV